MDFKEVRELFRDKIDINLYVPLYQKLEIDLAYAIAEKEKMVLIVGEAGNGKTFLMKKVFDTYKNENMYFISNPFEKKTRLEAIFSIEDNKHKVVFIDEAQMLSENDIEKLRILSDSNKYTIILATHEKNGRYIFAKKHFQTRINYFIHLKPLPLDKIELFITSKLVGNGYASINGLFTKKNYKLIYKITKGNLREVNKLLYKTFDVLDYFYTNSPNKISRDKIDNKFIEIAAMDLKGIYA